MQKEGFWTEAPDRIGGSKPDATESQTNSDRRQREWSKEVGTNWVVPCFFIQDLKIKHARPFLSPIKPELKLDRRTAKEGLLGPHPGVTWS